MSNASLLSRIKDELLAFERKERSPREFCAILVSSVEGLEGASYSTIQEMRSFRHRVEVGGFAEEEGCAFERQAVAMEIRNWLSALEQPEANQSPQTTRAFGPRV